MTSSETIHDVVDDPAAVVAVDARASSLRTFLRRFRGDRWAMCGVAIILLLVALGLLAPLLSTHAPEANSLVDRLKGPSADHWLGTDDLGRDVYSRLLYATRVSLQAAATSVLVSTILGLPLGIVAGYRGGAVDMIISRLADALMSFPTILLAIAVIAALGPGLTNAMIALGIVYAPRLFRVVRAATLGVRQQPYVEASVSLGAPAFDIMRRHVLRNILPPVLVQLSLLMSFAILAEASLSFLGLGVQPPGASWGIMLGRAFETLRSAPLLIVWPGLALAAASMGFNMIGDGLRDALGREERRG